MTEEVEQKKREAITPWPIFIVGSLLSRPSLLPTRWPVGSVGDGTRREGRKLTIWEIGEGIGQAMKLIVVGGFAYMITALVIFLLLAGLGLGGTRDVAFESIGSRLASGVHRSSPLDRGLSLLSAVHGTAGVRNH
jgi:hypothetical protein